MPKGVGYKKKKLPFLSRVRQAAREKAMKAPGAGTTVGTQAKQIRDLGLAPPMEQVAQTINKKKRR